MPKTNQKTVLFLTVFHGRQDVVPCFWISRDGQRSGYSPLCSNEWKEGTCQKPCRACQSAEYIPLSGQLVLDHFQGKHILGIYPLMPDNTCYFIAADFDNHAGDRDPLTDARAYYEVALVNGFRAYLLRSKSGNGYHVYIFFDGPIPAWKARLVAFAMLREAQVIGDDVEISSFDRLFPSQDTLSGRGFGNLISLPLQGQAGRDGHTLILDPATDFKKPYRDQWSVLSGIGRVCEGQFDAIIKDWKLEREPSRPNEKNGYGKAGENADRFLDCDFIKWCREYAEKVGEPLWYSLVSNVICLRPGGYSLVHELSRNHPNYSPGETDSKIHQALDSSGPHTCLYIQENGFRCDRNCTVKAPAALIFNRERGNKQGIQNGNAKRRINLSFD